MIGGLCLFLFGMNIMGQALERRAGSKLTDLLGKLTSNKYMGFLTGLGVTAIIQSSSATTVIVVGFVNSSVMTLKQAISVIMGANIGTTVTAWILSLSGIGGDNTILKLLKPSSFTPVLALIGIIFYMFCKGAKKKDTGTILLGFATLMFGMETMSSSVSGLSDVPAFRELFLMFENPFLGMLAGAVLTAIIQSSSASVGILQALATTGQISFGAAIPIIMGQNIGTCITAILSSVGANKNAKRAAFVHLSFNAIGTIVWLTVFSVARAIFSPAILDAPATLFGIAVSHSAFNILCTLLLFPASGLLEKLANRVVHDAKQPEKIVELDERLIKTPALALERAHSLTEHMAKISVDAIKNAVSCLSEYSSEKEEIVRQGEDMGDHYEDILGSYLVKLSSSQIGYYESAKAAMLLHLIGDFERISDHSVNIIESCKEMRDKNISFTDQAKAELDVLSSAVIEILDLSLKSFVDNDIHSALRVEPLEEVIDSLKESMRAHHILRLQKNECTIEVGFVWSDLLTNFERIADHCSNIAGCIIDFANHNMNLHQSLREYRTSDATFDIFFKEYNKKYRINA